MERNKYFDRSVGYFDPDHTTASGYITEQVAVARRAFMLLAILLGWLPMPVCHG